MFAQRGNEAGKLRELKVFETERFRDFAKCRRCVLPKASEFEWRRAAQHGLFSSFPAEPNEPRTEADTRSPQGRTAPRRTPQVSPSQQTENLGCGAGAERFGPGAAARQGKAQAHSTSHGKEREAAVRRVGLR